MKLQTKNLVVSLALGLCFVIAVGIVWYLSQPKAPASNDVVVAHDETESLSPTSQILGAAQDGVSILAWNVELDGGADAKVIAKQLKSFASPIIALSEVQPDTALTLNIAHPKYKAILGSSGRGIRLLFLIDTRRFEIVKSWELGDYAGHQMNNGNHHSPLVVRLKDANGTFLVVNNHLARCRANLRQSQARALREWARDQTEPIICVGHFNMDYSFETKSGNDAFNEMLKDSVWKWIKPIEMIDTNWSDRNNDGEDDYPESMLDFVFVANGFKAKSVSCEVVVTDGDFPDNEKTSDHRPVIIQASTDGIGPTLRHRIDLSALIPRSIAHKADAINCNFAAKEHLREIKDLSGGTPDYALIETKECVMLAERNDSGVMFFYPDGKKARLSFRDSNIADLNVFLPGTKSEKAAINIEFDLLKVVISLEGEQLTLLRATEASPLERIGDWEIEGADQLETFVRKHFSRFLNRRRDRL